MKTIRDEKAITLVEVLVALTILSLIVITIMNIFPQMGRMNQFNEEKTQAMNFAKELLIDWQESRDVQQFLAIENPTSGFHSADPKVHYHEIDIDQNAYHFVTAIGTYTGKIKIKRQPSNQANPVALHLITVQLFNEQDMKISETYGYILRGRD